MPDSINRERLEQVALDDVEFRDTLIRVYLEDARLQVAALARAVGEPDDDGLERSAHRLKGASANLGAEPLADLCAVAELHAQGINPVDDLPRLIRAISDEFHSVETSLGAIVGEGAR